MRKDQRTRFDGLLEAVLKSLPAHIHNLLDEAPLIIDDRPSKKLLKELDIDPDEEVLCGLHSGTPLTERSVYRDEDFLESIYLFREGIVEEAGGWSASDRRLKKEIRVTLLHEIGHHFGLDEDDLKKLGYD